MYYVSGEILTNKIFEKGYLGFEKKNIIELGTGTPPKKPICKGLIVPSFINAHTHIGDSFIKKKKIKLPRNIDELVKPPNGLKHKLLAQASEKEIVSGIVNSIDEMTNSGVKYFYDFRENGIKGIYPLKIALKNKKISSLILSRPKNLVYDKEEIQTLLDNSDGFGISGISDWNYSELKKVASQAKRRKKLFAIHASEINREDIDKVLDLKPDFLVHMIYANDSDFERVKNENIPIVICPRSNSYYGLKPKIKLIKKHNINLLLGTDNAMINSPNIIDEIKFLKAHSKEFSIEELLSMTTYGARKVLNWDCDILGANSRADFVVLDEKTLKPLYIST